MIIAIDGPAGSGKSSTAREVARRLGFLHLDSGALYRAFAYVACRHGWDEMTGPAAESRVQELADAAITASSAGGRLTVELDDQPIGDEELRTPRVTACASKVSAFPPIRDRVNELLRGLAAGFAGGTVTEGRDMGTVVFPGAELKVYMMAAPEVRAARRLAERAGGGGARGAAGGAGAVGAEGAGEVSEASIRAESARLVARDLADSERAVAPLRPASDAKLIDTSYLGFEEQVERVVVLARAHLDTG